MNEIFLWAVLAIVVALAVNAFRTHMRKVRRDAFYLGRRFVELKAAKGCFEVSQRELTDFEKQMFAGIVAEYISR
jgi:hypothetical protein